jgi:hypothetical protein
VEYHSNLQNAPYGVQSKRKGLLDFFFFGGHHKPAMPAATTKEIIPVAGHVDTFFQQDGHAYIQRKSSWTSCVACLLPVFCRIDFQSGSGVDGSGH